MCCRQRLRHLRKFIDILSRSPILEHSNRADRCLWTAISGEDDIMVAFERLFQEMPAANLDLLLYMLDLLATFAKHTKVNLMSVKGR